MCVGRCNKNEYGRSSASKKILEGILEKKIQEKHISQFKSR